jgi:Cu/Ag efflux protein CusF
MLATVAVGDKVRFVAVDQDGKMLVTHIQPAR